MHFRNKANKLSLKISYSIKSAINIINMRCLKLQLYKRFIKYNLTFKVIVFTNVFKN